MEKVKETTKRIYAYARVSTREQNLDRQVILFKDKYKIDSKNIYAEKISGRISGKDRPVFSYLIDVLLREGDTLVIDSISRLGRTYKDILENWKLLNKLGIYVVVDDMPFLDTRPNSKDGGVMTELIIDLVTTLLAYCADREVAEKKRAQMAGIEAARKAGKCIGRPRVEIPDNFPKEYRKWKSGQQTATQTIRRLGMSHSTFYRIVKIYEKKKI
ncbi:hypothetical protein B5E87_00145 [Massilimicrobiota sp. An142]|uniref:recombinase family protein n=1 Tax=Massilimicrobiota sp. An142 TaxID=1965564 RepID=UPI000B38EF16|nr:recombinase family protein [Massilimicrobiota sp. An142]OUQ15016.1 hypothetical protein B5E87_00145 [Massilimicrobiota sp. An142]